MTIFTSNGSAAHSSLDKPTNQPEMAPTSRRSNGRQHDDQDSATDAVEKATRQDVKRRAISQLKAIKVIPILDIPRPEIDVDDPQSTRVTSNSGVTTVRTKETQHIQQQQRFSHDGQFLTSSDCTQEKLKKRKPKSIQNAASRGRTAFQSTLRMTKKTAASFVRVASSRSRTSDLSSRFEDLEQARDQAKASLQCKAPPPQPQAAPPLQGLPQSLMDTLDTLQVPPWKETKTAASVAADQAWKHLLVVPSSRFWIVWNLLHLLALGYICTVVPYMTALSASETDTQQQEQQWSDKLNRAIDIFYILDVCVNFRACFIDSETSKVVTDATRIAVHYMQSNPVWFVFDIVMAFPFDLVLQGGGGGSTMTFTFVRILRLLRLAKLLRILKLRPLLDFCEDNFGISRNKLVVVQLLATIAFVAHLTACGFVLAATVGPSLMPSSSSTRALGASSSHGGQVAAGGSHRSWIQVNDLEDAPSGEIYVAALYWAFTMMTTVGFGDIVPVTLAERVYSILAMVISAGTYAYVIASMSTIVALMNLQQARYYEKINELNAYMASRQLPPALQLRTRQFFRYYLAKKTVFDEHALFDALPTNLREELVEHHVKTAMHHITFFHHLPERGFISDIALFLRPVFFPPASLIVKLRDHAMEMYFISKGTFQVITCGSAMGGGAVSPEHSPTKALSGTGTIASSIAQYLSPRRSTGGSNDGARGSGTSASGEEHQERLVTTLHDGDYFGEMALLCDAPRHRRVASVRSVTYCELHSLSYSHLAPSLDRYAKVFKQMRAAAHCRMAVLENLHKSKLDHLVPHE